MTTTENENVLYRTKSEDHICPFGLRAKDLLEREGIEFDDITLSNQEETDRIKSDLNVQTTPQIILGGERIGGFEDLQRHFGKTPKADKEKTYFPVISLFSIAAVAAIALAFNGNEQAGVPTFITYFVGLAMIMLGLLKLQDVEGFANGFLGYDLLAQRHVRYAFVYPFAETFAGLLMLASLLPVVSIPIMIFIGGVGGVSVIKAVYIDKRDIKCACVGGGSKVPLGFVSLMENFMMFGAGIWMMVRIGLT